VNFEPYLQPGGVVDNTWQTWNVMSSSGVIWGTHITNSTCAPAGGANAVNWSTFLTYYPSASILPLTQGGGVGFGVGSNWTPMTGNVGQLTFGTSTATTTYIFAPCTGLQFLTTTSLPAAAVNTTYSAKITACGGNPGYRFSVLPGELPKGLHVKKATGVVHGRAGVKGTYTFTVKVTDHKSKTKPHTRNTASEVLSITIS
jgi:hypothetical protein